MPDQEIFISADGQGFVDQTWLRFGQAIATGAAAEVYQTVWQREVVHVYAHSRWNPMRG
ncbi:hypothetical protein BCCH1_79440 (plasmid) [Burkholderia contaminans]|uniref:Uncharacterized protein n=1 Tax=Burkholderia contaminans TaxID=488447 RepID=A0A250LLQ0_9BURK|nr:hypothetical protein BCCH1_79440 [Burkholderia contaminans]